jgi:hypothetical protein|uniref:Uncharacterized protein n=1 Tax=Siphoviridae sp. ctHip2 TaxID=2827830 RepID=A0A8S5RVC9_9CAUD|nr:MAG TPA: hypothetical protein [Siphoviridae sp. ctHip2]
MTTTKDLYKEILNKDEAMKARFVVIPIAENLKTAKNKKGLNSITQKDELNNKNKERKA